MLDTRTGVGVAAGAVPPGGTVAVQVTGRGPLPESGVSAVVVNVTVTGATGSGYLTVWADGTARPTASNLNFVAGQTVPNLVLAPVGGGGRISLFNGSSGSVQLIADVAGYVVAGAPTAPGAVGSLDPTRLLDTRAGIGVPKARLEPGGTILVQMSGRGGVPATGVSAVVLNVTVAAPTAGGYVTAFASGRPRPTSSNLNFVAGQTVPNLVLAPLGADGKVAFYDGGGARIDLIADVAGYVRSGTASAPGSLGVVDSARVLDTRTGVGAPLGAVAPLGTVAVQVAGRGGVPAQDVAAVFVNVTVTGPTQPGYLTAYADGANRPTASNLNFFHPGQTVPNLVLAPVGVDGRIRLFNGSAGSTQVIADVSGYLLRGPRAVVRLVGRSRGYCALLSTGGVDCWGYGFGGANGNGATTNAPAPVAVRGVGGVGLLSGVARLQTNGLSMCAVLDDSGVDCWGSGYAGQLGNGAQANASTPIRVLGPGGAGFLSGVVSLGEWAGRSDSDSWCAVLADGRAACWGLNLWGSLGNGTTTSSSSPVIVKGIGGVGSLTGVTSIASNGDNGYTTHCAVRTGGAVACWGYGHEGELGDGTTTSAATVPVAVHGIDGAPTLTGVQQLKGTSETFCGLVATGAVDCWGRVGLGDGSTTSSPVPVPVSGVGGTGRLAGAALVGGLGVDESCALMAGGTAACWGATGFEQFATFSYTPVAVPGIGGSGSLSGVAALGSNLWTDSCAVLTTGAVRCWGTGLHGGLGTGTSADSRTPVAVVDIGGAGALSGATAVTGDSNGFSMCAARTSARMACWGQGSEGQLGNGTTGTAYSPVAAVLP